MMMKKKRKKKMMTIKNKTININNYFKGIKLIIILTIYKYKIINLIRKIVLYLMNNIL